MTALIGLTGLGSVQAEITINRVDSISTDRPTGKSSVYIVQMKGNPVVSYEGDVAGYKATNPGKGQKINPNSAHVKKYAAYLETQQDQAFDSVAADKVIRNYCVAKGLVVAVNPVPVADLLAAAGTDVAMKTISAGRAAETWFAKGKSWGTEGPKDTIKEILDSLDQDSILRSARGDILGRLNSAS